VATSTADTRLQWYGFLVGGSAAFVSWNLSTLAGAVLVPRTGTLVEDLGIDATIPAAFLALVWPRLHDRVQRRVAIAGAVIAVPLVPVLPAGLPIIAAAVVVPAALWLTRGSAGDARSGAAT
jgi:predicted branched-subunit amino acid permease